MAITPTLMSLFPPRPILFIFKSRPSLSFLKSKNSAPRVISPIILSSSIFPTISHHPQNPQKRQPLIWRICASPEEALPLDTTPIESSQQVVSSTGDDGVATIVSFLLFIAFVTLSVLTIGVIYIGVTDFLQKREREKFEKEETANSRKKGGKKRKLVRARAGPKGFGQKIEDDAAFDD